MNNLCEIYILSLLRDDRIKYVEINKQKFPFIKIIKSVNGYDINETLYELNKIKQLNIKYNNLEYKTYGTLANWITKFKILKYQVDHNIPYICFLEDDVILEDNFYDYINDSTKYLKDNINILRLLKHGEGYITSVEGAKKIIEHMEKSGIIDNIDNQLKNHCGKELKLKNAPIKLVVPTNKGDCLKTKSFETLQSLESLQSLETLQSLEN